MTTILRVTYGALLVAALTARPAAAAQVQISSAPTVPRSAQSTLGVVTGTVTLAAADGQPVAMPGVTLTLTCETDQPRTEVSDEQGAYRFADVPAGTCSIAGTMDGAQSMTKTIAVQAGHAIEVALTLTLVAVHQQVDVTGSPDGHDSNPIAGQVERMSARTLQSAPLANDRFQDAMPLIPGVVRGPDGLMNISGSRSNQAALMLSHTLGTDPVTGEDAVNLPLDAISDV